MDQRRTVRSNGISLSLWEWGNAHAPTVLCVPGTGLAAELFCGVAGLLGDEWHGYSLDRRGHGRSDRPDSGYDFVDFAADLVGTIDSLGLQGVLGIGHSAGGTDMLLAAAARPAAFERLIIIEPTVQDPRIPVRNEPPADWEERVERSRRRRTAFPGVEAVFERWSQVEPFNRIRPDLLRRYIEGAFVPRADGTVELRCRPEHEVQMLHPILSAMSHSYRPPPGRTDPFALLEHVPAPVTLVTMGQSGDRYAPMAAIAAEILPNIRQMHLPESGHLLPLESPESVAEIVMSNE